MRALRQQAGGGPPTVLRGAGDGLPLLGRVGMPPEAVQGEPAQEARFVIAAGGHRRQSSRGGLPIGGAQRGPTGTQRCRLRLGTCAQAGGRAEPAGNVVGADRANAVQVVRDAPVVDDEQRRRHDVGSAQTERGERIAAVGVRRAPAVAQQVVAERSLIPVANELEVVEPRLALALQRRHDEHVDQRPVGRERARQLRPLAVTVDRCGAVVRLLAIERAPPDAHPCGATARPHHGAKPELVANRVLWPDERLEQRTGLGQRQAAGRGGADFAIEHPLEISLTWLRPVRVAASLAVRLEVVRHQQRHEVICEGRRHPRIGERAGAEQEILGVARIQQPHGRCGDRGAGVDERAVGVRAAHVDQQGTPPLAAVGDGRRAIEVPGDLRRRFTRPTFHVVRHGAGRRGSGAPRELL